jgi:uncharacterized protein DUF5670
LLARKLLFYVLMAGAVGRGGQDNMLETLIVVLVILWLLGMVSSYTLGGFIHILLVIAIVVLLLRVIQGRRVV